MFFCLNKISKFTKFLHDISIFSTYWRYPHYVIMSEEMWQKSWEIKLLRFILEQCVYFTKYTNLNLNLSRRAHKLNLIELKLLFCRDETINRYRISLHDRVSFFTFFLNFKKVLYKFMKFKFKLISRFHLILNSTQSGWSKNYSKLSYQISPISLSTAKKNEIH